MIKSQTSVWLFLCDTVSRSPGEASTPPPGLDGQSRRRYARPAGYPHVTLTPDGLISAAPSGSIVQIRTRNSY